MNWLDLKQAVQGYAKRSDIPHGMLLPAAEQRIYYGEQNTPAVRVDAMRATMVANDGAMAPFEFLEAIKVYPCGRPDEPLDYHPLSVVHQQGGYSWDQGALVLPDGGRVEIIYYQRLPSPVEDTDANWLMEFTPNVYLSSMLIEAARWSVDDVLGAREAAQYTSTVQALLSQQNKAASSGARLVMRRR